MTIRFADNATAKLITNLSSSATNVVVDTQNALLFPALSAGDFFMVTLEDRSQTPVLREICKCTGIAGNVLTVVRAQEGTPATAFTNASTLVSNRLTAGTLAAIIAATGYTSQQLFLGQFANDPPTNLIGVPVIAGNLYYNTTHGVLREYTGSTWINVTSTTTTGLLYYLGSSPTAPTLMLDGTPIVNGCLYFNTTNTQLFEFNGVAWVSIAGSTTTVGGVVTGNQDITGNLHVHGTLEVDQTTLLHGTLSLADAVASGDVSALTMHLNSHLIVDMGDASGDSTVQRFPSGTRFKFGTAATDGTGTTLITFAAPFPNQCLGFLVAPMSIGATVPKFLQVLLHLDGTLDPGGSQVVSVTASGTLSGPVTFSYLAWGF